MFSLFSWFVARVFLEIRLEVSQFTETLTRVKVRTSSSFHSCVFLASFGYDTLPCSCQYQMSTEKPVVGSRVNQLDAVELDDELFALFRNKLSDVFRHVGGNFYPTFEPEIKAILKAILYGFTLYECGATVGQRLLGLEFFASGTSLSRITRRQTCALILLGIGLPWFRERCLKIFLRVLPQVQSNTVQFDFMNRELLWHGFAEFIGFLLPLVNVYPAKNFVSRKLLRRKLRPTNPSARTQGDMAECGICGSCPTQPHEIGCKHVFCYYCIASQVTADAKYSCPLCNCPSMGTGEHQESGTSLRHELMKQQSIKTQIQVDTALSVGVEAISWTAKGRHTAFHTLCTLCTDGFQDVFLGSAGHHRFSGRSAKKE
ncbi:peroxisome biogenesis factor 2 isoform X2 [Dermacentor silvarum]|uniref:peroxisome biogenesis factor 2 isoform X2 n=1 Tax=Dermacentor silvarum TaxID=543639 RepID=UPI002101BDB3|nr:peroxisome biogenesis factor 2 isoform X2 [Dermacentor silvarum]